ncbi:MAG: hypothetical protein IPN90_11470 [Elusimicrobia bacterium]|nr:hypothetical protein [Elusimicrobiota bacterium]
MILNAVLLPMCGRPFSRCTRPARWMQGLGGERVSKGIENNTLKRMSEVIGEAEPENWPGG